MQANSPLVVENLSVNRSKRVVLDDVSLTIERGEFVGLVGPNGGGKTTFLLTILGILKPIQGSVELFGSRNPSSNIFRKIGWVSQHASNIPKNIKITVRELVELGTLNSSNMFWIYNSEQKERVARAIELTGLKSVEDRNIFNLSGGQRQRAVIARALASNAEFILLDEPLVGLDRESRNSLLNFLDRLCHEIVLKLFAPLLEYIAPLMPGKTFSKFFFEMEIGQQALLASIFVTLVSGFLGVFC